jgi:hypothetical protein
MGKKTCAQCGAKIGLGVRFLNRWTGQAWQHLRFCSKLCEENNELEHHVEVQRRRTWFDYLSRASP